MDYWLAPFRRFGPHNVSGNFIYFEFPDDGSIFRGAGINTEAYLTHTPCRGCFTLQACVTVKLKYEMHWGYYGPICSWECLLNHIERVGEYYGHLDWGSEIVNFFAPYLEQTK